METKFTREGKKVAVIGKLNNEEWIVQEIFVADGKEFPAGENFTTKTLLDKPAETYHSRRKTELEQQIKRTEQEIKQLDKKAEIASRKNTVARLINYATEKYANIDLEQLDTLFAFMSGDITHIISERYGDYSLTSLIDEVEATDSWHGRIKSDGLRLVTLFGCRTDCTRGDKDRSFRLDWKINQYRDYSGCWNAIYPCTSYEQAVEKLDELISKKEKATEKFIELKNKYNLKHPTQEKIDEYYKAIISNKNQNVKNAEKKLLEAKAELEDALKGE